MYNSYFCLYQISLPDQVSRKKMKNLMEISMYKKITISATGKNLVVSPPSLSIPFAALTYITGQKCAVVRAHQSVSSWKLRKNTPIGCKVTLRRRCAFIFLDKLYIYGIACKYFKNAQQFDNCFGVSKNNYFFETQKLGINSSSFSGFSVSLN